MSTSIRQFVGLVPKRPVALSPISWSLAMRSLAAAAAIGGISNQASAIEITKTVLGTANIYGAGHTAPPVAGFGGSGTMPPNVNLIAGVDRTLQIVATTGSVTLDKVTNNAGLGPSGPDGGPFYSPTDVTSTGGLSGIKSNVTGFLTGVFLNGYEPTGSGPPVLDFTTAGKGTNFETLSPQIGQVFFIGDGRTKSGAIQQFKVPPTAKQLFLGIVDAADGDNAAGPPQAYDDNGGQFKATLRIEMKSTKIIYNNASGNLFLMNADGSNKQNLTSGSYYAENGELSGDGKFISFRGSQAAPGPGGGTLSGVWVMKAEPVGPSNTPVLVSTNLNYGYNFSWHPDGQYLAMGEYVTSSPLVSVLRVRNANGEITPEGVTNPAVRMTIQSADYYYSGANFSPDGQYLAMSNKGKQIFLLKSFNNAGELTPESASNPIIQVGTLDLHRLAGTPEWSADAMSVAFPQITLDNSFANPTSQIAVLRVRNSSGNVTPETAGNPRVNYTSSTPGNYTTLSPSWSADGKNIAFASAPDNVSFYNTFTILAKGPEDNSTNPRIPVTTDADGGTLTPSFAQARKLIDLPPAEFQVELTGLKDGQVLLPNTDITLRARLTPTEIPGVTIKKVQFFVNGVGKTPDTTVPYEYSGKISKGGRYVVTATSTDSLNRVVNSQPLHFDVAPAKAGQLALQTEILPNGTSIAPGKFLTYRMKVTNTHPRNTATDVKIVAPIPRRCSYEDCFALNDTGAKIYPRPRPDSGRTKVTYQLGDIPPGKTFIAVLEIFVPYDFTPSQGPIENRNFEITGVGVSKSALAGSFATVEVPVAGSQPTNAPRLALFKAIIDKENDSNDDYAWVKDDTYGSIPGAGYGEIITILLVGSNQGGLPARKLKVVDLVPVGCELVANSARVNNVAVTLTSENRTLNFTLGDLPAGEIVAITYQIRIKDRTKGESGAPLLDATLLSRGAEVGTLSLISRPDSIPEIVPFKVVTPVALNVTSTTDVAPSVVGGKTTYTLTYENSGAKAATGVLLVDELPPGTSLGTAKFEGQLAGQSVVKGTNKVTFKINNLAPGEKRRAFVTVNVLAKARDLDVPEIGNIARLYDDKYYRPQPATASAGTGMNRMAARIRSRSAHASGTQSNDSREATTEDRNIILDPSIPRIGLMKIMPPSVTKGNKFQVTLSPINASPVFATNILVTMPVPAGAEFVSADPREEYITGFIPPDPEVPEFPRGLVYFFGSVRPQEAESLTFTFRAVGIAGTKIIDEYALVEDGRALLDVGGLYDPIAPVFALASSTTILDNTVEASRDRIAGGQLSLWAFDAPFVLSNGDVAKSVGKISSETRNIFVSGVDHIQLKNGSVLIPLGGGYLVAAGGGNLVAAGGGNILSQNGSTLVAAGGGNLITFSNLVGNDGASLGAQSGATILNKLFTKAPGNLVAAGGGNLVAAGAGNLVAAGGGNLVGNDGGTLSVTIASLVAAGGGNLVAAGGGNLSYTNPGEMTESVAAALTANGGYGIAAGGGVLKSGNVPYASPDDTAAVMMGANGAMLGGSGGVPLVAAGGGN